MSIYVMSNKDFQIKPTVRKISIEVTIRKWNWIRWVSGWGVVYVSGCMAGVWCTLVGRARVWCTLCLLLCSDNNIKEFIILIVSDILYVLGDEIVCSVYQRLATVENWQLS